MQGDSEEPYPDDASKGGRDYEDRREEEMLAREEDAVRVSYEGRERGTNAGRIT
jgi:hypothetical protein